MNLAVVTPWFGADLQGGAERVAWQAATGLAARGHAVTVLTTCSAGFNRDWSENAYAAGTSVQNGLTIRRFPLDTRNAERFNRVNQKLLSAAGLKRGVSPLSAEEAEAFADDNINSDALLTHLKDNGTQYDRILFLPYLYGPILRSWRCVADRAFVQPCLHEEAYAFLPAVAEMMRGVRGLLFNSEGEREIARRLYGPGIDSRAVVVGSAIELQLESKPLQPIAIGKLELQKERYVLYLGRRAETKNVDFLIAVFRRFCELFKGSSLRLVLAGPGTANYQDRSAGIYDLGLVSEEEKVRLLQGCLALAQPSTNESYSRTMMEAWLCGRPVAVHAKCAATSQAVQSAGGGWIADTLEDWLEVLAFVDRSPAQELNAIGAQAAPYVRAFASWAGVLDRYEMAFRLNSAEGAEKRAVHQMIESLSYGDAVSIQALGIREALRSSGHESKIFAQHVDGRMAAEGSASPPKGGDVWVVHTAETGETAHACAHEPVPKVLIVHGEGQQFARSFKTDAEAYGTIYASSPVAVRSLRESLGRTVRQYDPVLDPSRWNIAPDVTLMNALQDGKRNILCIKAIQRSNRQRELLEAFAHYLSMDLNARLILAGRFDFEDPYYQDLLHIVHGGALSQHVLITGLVSEPALAALYSTAHVYCSLAEREPLGATLIEAMLFDVPVCAYANEGSARVLGSSGILIRDISDLLALAALLKVVATDAGVRTAVLKSQQVRRLAFSASAAREQVEEMTAVVGSLFGSSVS